MGSSHCSSAQITGQPSKAYLGGESMIEYYSGITCLCGCNNKIQIKEHHRWTGIPRFISGHNKAHLGFKCSNESRKRMSDAHKGQDLSKIHKLNCKCFICKAIRGEGRACSEITKKKIGLANSGENNGMHGRTNEKCPAWRGGVSFVNYGTEFTKQLKEQVRDNFNRACFICGINEKECKTKLDVHHIDYNKKNNTIDNLICLCKICHTKTNFNRDYWERKLKYDLVHS